MNSAAKLRSDNCRYSKLPITIPDAFQKLNGSFRLNSASCLMIVLDKSLLEKAKVVSFDLFDTLFLRQISRPEDLFFFLGMEMGHLCHLEPSQFKKKRLRAEKIAKIRNRILRRKKETTIDEIYEVLRRDLKISQELKNSLIDREMALEAQFIYVNPEVHSLMRQSQEMGKRVVFASDMYLPYEFLQGLLKHHGLFSGTADTRLYLSSALNRIKRRDGSLFDYLVAEEKIAFSELLHIGDNYNCDYLIPRKKGIFAVHYDREKANYLGTSKSNGLAKNPFFNYLNSASDRAHHRNLASIADKELNILSSFISGPILFSYVYWLMSKALENNLERLYFLSRDGDILIKIANLIKCHYNLKIDLRYLYASRISWMLPSIIDFDNLEKERAFFNFAKYFNITNLLGRFKINNIDDILLKEKLSKYNLSKDEPITILNLLKVKNFIKDPEILQLIKNKSDEEFSLLEQYLEQEGLFDGRHYSLVDIGWRGTLSNALRRVFIKKGINDINILTFYFDILRPPLHVGKDIFLSFLKETQNEYNNGIRGELEVLMELFTYGNHKSVYGFKRNGEKIEPIFMEEDLETKREWGIGTQQDLVLTFSEEILNSPLFEKTEKKIIYDISLQVLYSFLNKPNISLVQKICKFPYNTEMVRRKDEYGYSVSSPFLLKDIIEMIKRVHIVRIDDSWIQGSLALTKNPFTKLFFLLFYSILSIKYVKKVEIMLRNKMGF